MVLSQQCNRQFNNNYNIYRHVLYIIYMQHDMEPDYRPWVARLVCACCDSRVNAYVAMVMCAYHDAHMYQCMCGAIECAL